MALAVIAVLVALGGCRTSPRIDGAPPRVELRLASFEPVDGYTPRRSRQGETLLVAPEPVVDLEDIHMALVRQQGKDDFLLLNLKAGTQLRLDSITAGHLERPVVVMIDDEVVYAPLLRTSISRQVPVRIGANGITVEDAQRVMDAVADQRDFGPWSTRSGNDLVSRAGRARAARVEAARVEAASAASAPVTAPPAPPPAAPGPGR